MKGKVRQVIQSEVINRCGISEGGVTISKQSEQQALRKEDHQVIVKTAKNSDSSKGFLAEVDS